MCANVFRSDINALALSILVTDVSLLLIMLVGLLRLRHRDGTFFNLAYVVWMQVWHYFCWL